jgi:hypothetical protein
MRRRAVHLIEAEEKHSVVDDARFEPGVGLPYAPLELSHLLFSIPHELHLLIMAT